MSVGIFTNFCSVSAVGEKDKLIRCWGQRSDHDETRYGQKLLCWCDIL